MTFCGWVEGNCTSDDESKEYLPGKLGTKNKVFNGNQSAPCLLDWDFDFESDEDYRGSNGTSSPMRDWSQGGERLQAFESGTDD